MEHLVDASALLADRNRSRSLPRSLESLAVISRAPSSGLTQSTNTPFHLPGGDIGDIAHELHLKITGNIDELAFMGGHLEGAQLGSPTATAGEVAAFSHTGLETFMNSITPAFNMGIEALVRDTNVNAPGTLGQQDLDRIRRIVAALSTDYYEVAVALFDENSRYLAESTSAETPNPYISMISELQEATTSSMAPVVGIDSNGTLQGSPTSGVDDHTANEDAVDFKSVSSCERSMSI